MMTKVHERLEGQSGHWGWWCISTAAIADMAVRTLRVRMESNVSEKQGSLWTQLSVFAWRQLETLGEGSAIAALGWDLIIGLFSATVCWVASARSA